MKFPSRGLRLSFLSVLLVSAASALAASASFNFAIVDGVVSGVPDQTVAVKQGDDVTLKWTSDKPIEIHLHGYDIERKVAPDAPVTMAFKAVVPGRFPIEAHGQAKGRHGALVYLEVRP
jgi:hypothetical protein